MRLRLDYLLAIGLQWTISEGASNENRCQITIQTRQRRPVYDDSPNIVSSKWRNTILIRLGIYMGNIRGGEW